MQSNIPKKILIIDDEKELCSILTEFFSTEGFVVEVAHNGIEGLSQVEKFAPDVILLDIKMPQMRGDECLAKIVKITTSPIIIVSGSLSEKRKEYCMVSGAYEFISKPINLDFVLEKVHSALKNKC
ncbi:MAG: hypothetical protein COV66_10470 [Nitrospinae bacterium CG11_big_fil_rev_8_21_14_0_20_45_15]|nr:MAG: hypothetical protein COV66_10470 [Nitrospinae bacterium CG11_big_fil_rev_8_21_14_0_20_45_15]